MLQRQQSPNTTFSEAVCCTSALQSLIAFQFVIYKMWLECGQTAFSDAAGHRLTESVES